MAEASERIRQLIDETRADLDERIEILASRAEQAVSLKHQIKAHPWVTVAIAAATGLLVGRLDASRRHRAPRVGAEDTLARESPDPALGPWLGAGLEVLTTSAVVALSGLLRDLIRGERPAPEARPASPSPAAPPSPPPAEPEDVLLNYR
jgi:hypothetical protein